MGALRLKLARRESDRFDQNRGVGVFGWGWNMDMRPRCWEDSSRGRYGVDVAAKR
jgi:hypothetical protein